MSLKEDQSITIPAVLDKYINTDHIGLFVHSVIAGYDYIIWFYIYVCIYVCTFKFLKNLYMEATNIAT